MNNAIPELFERQGIVLDFLITGLVGITLTVITGLLFVWRQWFLRKHAGADGFAFTVVGGSSGFVALIIWLTLLAFLAPYNSQYWHYYTVTADVESVSNVLTEASGDLTRQPVVKLNGMDRPVVVDDPRAVDLEGKRVTLRCTIAWHYQAADTYNCKIVNYVEVEK